jgi:hypothetical protein
MSTSIHITYVNDKTLKEMTRNGEQKVFSKHEKNSVPDGAIIVCINKDTKSIVYVGVADGTFTPRSLLDPDVFDGTDAKYQKSELRLKSRREIDLPLTIVGAACGIPPDNKVLTNINKCTAIQYARVFYKGEHEDEILRKYRILILALVDLQ